MHQVGVANHSFGFDTRTSRELALSLWKIFRDMGLYLRKSFRAGPIRFNLSKSGLGISAGVKGARVGAGPRGSYVNAGRYGLYYRKNLSTKRSRNRARAENEGCLTLIVLAAVVGFGVWLFDWLSSNPRIFVGGISIVISIAVVRWSILLFRKFRVIQYKKLLDSVFISSESLPSPEDLSTISHQQHKLPKNRAIKNEIERIESNVYHAVLDKILDDGFISKAEAAVISAADQFLRLSKEAQLQTKKEVFSAAYIEAIEDRLISGDEIDKLNNLKEGLAIPHNEVEGELNIVQEIIDTQALHLPLKSISADRLAIRIQKSESAFYQCKAQVLSMRKSKSAPSGYEYTVRRDGTMVITNKRVIVDGDGTTNIRFSDISDLDVDIDKGFIEISKVGSGRPLILKVKSPIYVGRTIDLLISAHHGESNV